MIAAFALLAWPSAAAADERFAPEDRYLEGPMAADDGRFVFFWEEADLDRFNLFEGYGPGAVSLGAPGADGPLELADVHLGTDAQRQPVLAFSYRTDELFDIYRYDFRTRRATRLSSSRDHCDEAGARILRGVVYFERYEGSQRARRRCPSGVFAKRPGRKERRFLSAVPGSWDVSPQGAIAFERQIVGPSPGDGSGRRGTSEVRVKHIGRRGSRLVASARFRVLSRDFYKGPSFGGVTLDEGFVYWLRSDEDSRTVDLLRNRIGANGRTTELSSEGRSFKGRGGLGGAESFVVDGDEIYYYSVPLSTRGAIFKVGPGPPRFE